MALAVLVALCVMFASASLRQQRDLANIRENARMEEQAMDEYVRVRPVPLDFAGLPVYYGDPRAKVAVLEFFNFDCGVCRTASSVIKTIADRYPGRVKVYLKNYPLDGRCNRHVSDMGDGLSCRASIISVALQKSPHYAAYVSHIMSGRERLSKELILEALGKINVDAKKLGGYMDEQTAARILAAQTDAGAALGIQGTPTFVINGKALPSGLPPARFLDRVIRLEVDRAYGTK
jgi:protein-disulfide isomerase